MSKLEMRVVVPAFLGGVRAGAQVAPAKWVRTTAVKGALRFWWRALAWSAALNAGSSAVERLARIKAREQHIFGGVGKQANASRVVLMPIAWVGGPPRAEVEWPIGPMRKGADGASYLGWGVVESGGRSDSVPHRQGWAEGGSFLLDLRFSTHLSSSEVDDVLRASKIWGLMGGLGARARRGFGSLALQRLDQQDIRWKDEAEYLRYLWELIGEDAGRAPPPPYTAFSKQTRWAVIGRDRHVRRLMHQVGSFYRKAVAELRKPQRRALGLPRGREEKRRASPLLFHIHPVGDEYVGFAWWMPSTPYHPHLTQPQVQTEGLPEAIPLTWKRVGDLP